MLRRALVVATFLNVIMIEGSGSDCVAAVARGPLGNDDVKKDIIGRLSRRHDVQEGGALGLDHAGSWRIVEASQRSSSVDLSFQDDDEATYREPAKPVEAIKSLPAQHRRGDERASSVSDSDSDYISTPTSARMGEARFWEDVRLLEQGGIIDPCKKTKW
jgi:hypothetical protein